MPSQKLAAPSTIGALVAGEALDDAGAAAVLTMGQNVVFAERGIALEGEINFVEHGVGGEEHQHAASDGGDEFFQVVHDHLAVGSFVDLGIVGIVSRDSDQRLSLVIKGRGRDVGEVLVFPQEIGLSGVFQMFADSQGGAGQDDTVIGIKEEFFEDGHGVDGGDGNDEIVAPGAVQVVEPVDTGRIVTLDEIGDEGFLSLEPALGKDELAQEVLDAVDQFQLIVDLDQAAVDGGDELTDLGQIVFEFRPPIAGALCLGDTAFVGVGQRGDGEGIVNGSGDVAVEHMHIVLQLSHSVLDQAGNVAGAGQTVEFLHDAVEQAAAADEGAGSLAQKFQIQRFGELLGGFIL